MTCVVVLVLVVLPILLQVLLVLPILLVLLALVVLTPPRDYEIPRLLSCVLIERVVSVSC
jgi:hypothetical protein